MHISKIKLKYYIFIFLAIYYLQSCNIINPAENVPTYFHIDSFTFTSPANKYLSKTHDINAVWVYYNNSPIGVFDLPATFPVMCTGSGQLELMPGVLIDGQNNMMTGYPFYTIDTVTFNAQPGKIIYHQPKTTYFSAVKCTQISLFGSGTGSGITGFSTWGNTLPMTQYFDTFFCGKIVLNSPADSSVDSTSTTFAIAKGNSAFIEFDYKTTIPFYIGLQANVSTISSTPYYLTGLYPNAGWKHFYLSVADFNAQYQGTSYNMYIKANYDTSLMPKGIKTGTMLIANVQLITF